MYHKFFHNLEKLSINDALPLDTVIDNLSFNDAGLIPVITQDAKTLTVLMFAWMNRESLELSLATKQMTYWSRSRQQLWVKGKTSGHTQTLVSMAFDCDGDAIRCLVNQAGAACHTGRVDCFYINVDLDTKQVFIASDATTS